MMLSTQTWVIQIASSSPSDSFKVMYMTVTAEEKPPSLHFSQQLRPLRLLVEITQVLNLPCCTFQKQVSNQRAFSHLPQYISPFAIQLLPEDHGYYQLSVKYPHPAKSVCLTCEQQGPPCSQRCFSPPSSHQEMLPAALAWDMRSPTARYKLSLEPAWQIPLFFSYKSK